MQFYLAISSDGQTKILGTQADAKAVNKDFEPIDIPTDKPGLMAWIQQMLDETLNAQPAGSELKELVTAEDLLNVPGPIMSDPDDAPKLDKEWFDSATKVEPEPKWKGDRPAIKEGTVCSICARTPKGVKIMEQVYNAMEVEAAIYQMDTELRLNNVISLVESRKRELARSAERT